MQNVIYDQEMKVLAAKKDLLNHELASCKHMAEIEMNKEERIAMIKLDLATKLSAIPRYIPIWTPSVPVTALSEVSCEHLY